MPNIPQATRDKLAATGAAMTNGSYPIRNATDLENAYKGDYPLTVGSMLVNRLIRSLLAVLWTFPRSKRDSC